MIPDSLTGATDGTVVDEESSETFDRLVLLGGEGEERERLEEEELLRLVSTMVGCGGFWGRSFSKGR